MQENVDIGKKGRNIMKKNRLLCIVFVKKLRIFANFRFFYNRPRLEFSINQFLNALYCDVLKEENTKDKEIPRNQV